MEKFIFSRHSKKPNKDNPESKEFPGLSEEGVEHARKEKALELKKIIDQAPQDALIIFIGATEAKRTKSTAAAYVEGLKDLYEGNESVLILDKKEISEFLKARKEKTLNYQIESFAGILKSDENKDKKIVIDYPLFIKQFSFGKRWGFFGDDQKYFDYLDKKYGDDEEDAFKEWIETKGKTENISGPDPERVAEEYLFGMERLREFVKDYITNRPIILGAVSHRWDLDAVILKLIKGEVSVEGFNEISQGKLTETNEGAVVTIEGDKMRISWRGQDFEVIEE